MLLRIAMSAVCLLSMTLTSVAQSVKFDKEKSAITFVGSKPPKDGKTDSHTGGFKDLKAEAKVDWESPEKSSLSLTIKTESIFSDNPKLTEHLRNPDFFDVKKFPTIQFDSTKIEAKETEGKITGKLTMLGKTEEITIPYKIEVNDTDVILTADFKLDRTKWGMNYGVPNVNADVDVKSTLHFKR